MQACVGWLETGMMPTNVNDTLVVLIPKCESPSSMRDLRPISLCNVLFKIMSKVLANRSRLLLPSIISEFQSAFIPGRVITDNVLAAFEIVHYMKRKTLRKKKRYSLKGRY